MSTFFKKYIDKCTLHMIICICDKETWQGGFMKKEEILNASKLENKNKDLVEIEESKKASTYAAISMVVLACIYYVYEIVSGKGTNYALYSLITLYSFVIYGWLAIKVKKNRVLRIISAAIWGLLTVMLILGYFKVI